MMRVLVFRPRLCLVTSPSLLSINHVVYIDSVSFHVACESPLKSENGVVRHIKGEDIYYVWSTRLCTQTQWKGQHRTPLKPLITIQDAVF
jgi:hypothetical protein